MSKHAVVKPVCDIDFLQNADNVYRTPDYIVKQKISLCANKRGDVHSKRRYLLFQNFRARHRL